MSRFIIINTRCFTIEENTLIKVITGIGFFCGIITLILKIIERYLTEKKLKR
jgi:hypothetical protein